MMAVVKTGKVTEKMTAAYLVKLGKANSEQQKMAYEYFIEQLKKSGKKSTHSIGKVVIRNVMISRYIALREADGETDIMANVCREIAEDEGLNADGVEREYLKWKSQDEEAKQVDYRNVEKYFSRAARVLISDE